MTESHRRLAAIMFTDMVGYSALVQADEGAALEVLQRHNRVLRPLFAQFDGREVKTVGDAFLVEFGSALDAVRCALEIQRSLHEYNASAPKEWKIQIRIGVHVGDVVQSGEDVLGDAVNIASRIQALAEPGGVCLTQQVVDQVQNKISVPFVRLPAAPLKNIRLPVTVYRVVPSWEVSGGAPPLAVHSGGRQLAVLPLANISPDAADGYFADGLTEELISTLSQVRGLSVIARTSVMPYKTAPKSVAQVGVELGVDSVLEGSVRKAGNRIRITLQLIDVATQRHMWASSYNRDLDDVFAVQTDIAERTAEALRLELAPGEAAGEKRPPTANLAAYDFYLRGLVASIEHSGLDEAVHCFEQATRLDPGFAEAYAMWANAYVSAAGETVPMREVIPRARELALRAIQIDPNSSEAHAALANVVFQYDNDWARAESEFKKAISLNPNNVVAYRFYATMCLALGRFDEAKELTRRAIQLDPGGHAQGLLSWIEIESGNFDEGIRTAEAIRDKEPTELGPHVYLGIYLLALGRRAEAEREADAAVTDVGDAERFDHSLLTAMLGRPEEARGIAAEVERGEAKSYTSATHLAMLYSVLGEKSKALDLLEKDYRDGDRVLWLWHRGLYFDPIRDEPRFLALLRQYGLPSDELRRPRLGGKDPGAPGHARRRTHTTRG
ncbi:MAG: adenylate/guanylate cyclase domain-containing protein [Thermoplasmata archaeon]